MQVPSNLFLNKIGRPSIYLPTCMLVWVCIVTALDLINALGLILPRASSVALPEQCKTSAASLRAGFSWDLWKLHTS